MLASHFARQSNMPLHVEGSRRITYDTGPPTVASFISSGVAFAILGLGVYFTDDTPFVIIGAAIAAILILGLARRWIVECDIAGKRLKVVRKLFGYWSTTKIDCRFDECEALGVYQSGDEDITYGVHFKLRSGQRLSIPVYEQGLAPVSALVGLLTEATGIANAGVET
jgi:hypothetical protein